MKFLVALYSMILCFALDSSLYFSSHTQSWTDTHRKWMMKNWNNPSCKNSTKIFPVCTRDIYIQDRSSRCPNAVCVDGDCVITPMDTVEYMPPVESTRTCTLVQNSEDSSSLPFWGLDFGIPPLFLDQSTVNLELSGTLRSRHGSKCIPLKGVKIRYWHFTGIANSDMTSEVNLNTIRESSCTGDVVTSPIDGSFSILTTMPHSYGPPRHVNIMVEIEGYETLLTRIYFDKDPRLHQLVMEDDNLRGFDSMTDSLQSENTVYNLKSSDTRGDMIQNVLAVDPRVARLHFIDGENTATQDDGHFYAEIHIVMDPLPAPDNDQLVSAGAYNISGMWQDSKGGLIRLESRGTLVFATEHPHSRTWGSVFGHARGDTLFFDFRSIASEVEVFSTNSWLETGEVWSADISIGLVFPTNPFASFSADKIITWKGGGYSNIWTKIVEPNKYRFIKLEMTRILGEGSTGELVINEIELYHGYLFQTEIPRQFAKMVSPRTPSPLKVMCSSYIDDLRHCFKAFDGDDSVGSAWVTKSVGSRRHVVDIPQWVILDLGPREGDAIHPTALRIVCDKGSSNKGKCPMTFTLSGSNAANGEYDTIAQYDLSNYNNEYGGSNGMLFDFSGGTPYGKANGAQCGSCNNPPNFMCALNGFDQSCASRYCDEHGHCSTPSICSKGHYQSIEFSEEGASYAHCKLCPPGRYGNEGGQLSSQCSGLCAEGCYCSAGSISDCQFSCENMPSAYCPEGSGFPIQAGVGERTVPNKDALWDKNIELKDNVARVASIPCEMGHYCIGGKQYKCPIGRYGNSTLLSSEWCYGECEAGSYCPIGSITPIVCPKGYYCQNGDVKRICDGGHFGSSTGLKDRSCSGVCSIGHYCPAGSTSANEFKCPAGRYGDVQSFYNNSCSGLCKEGFYCPAGSSSSQQYECGSSNSYCPLGSSTPLAVPLGFYSVGGTNHTRSAIQKCEKGFYCVDGEKFPCRSGSYGNEDGLYHIVKPVPEFEDDFSCSGLCLPGYYCPPNSTSATQFPCPSGRYGSSRSLEDDTCTGICPLGHYCPLGASSPIPCPPGVYGGVLGLQDSSCSPLCSDNTCNEEARSVSRCRQGYYCEMGSVTATSTQCGRNDLFCPSGSAAPLQVTEGYYSTGNSEFERTGQHICEIGHYCVHGTKIPCAPGLFGATMGLTSPTCTGPCPAGHYCPIGSSNGTTYRCPAGRFGKEDGLDNKACSGMCLAGYFCPEGSTSEKQLECANFVVLENGNGNSVYCPFGSSSPLVVPAGYYSIKGNSSTREDIALCPMGTYCKDGVMHECPPGRYGKTTGLSTSMCSGLCQKGYYCPEGSISSIQFPCPVGRYGDKEGLESSECSGYCQNPFYCPEGSVTELLTVSSPLIY